MTAEVTSEPLGMNSPTNRWAWAEIDLNAIGHNIEVLRRIAAPASLWAVVKANGYGHGAVAVAERALNHGASGLCVALVSEGVQLRMAGITAPILVLSQQPGELVEMMVANGLTPTVYSAAMAHEMSAGVTPGLPVHVKVDTGMQRVGVPSHEAVDLIRLMAVLTPPVQIGGIFTHLACADDPHSPANTEQLACFDSVLAELDAIGMRPAVVHAANSAAILSNPGAHRSMVRVGIAMYGISPGPGVDHLTAVLKPAMSLHARASFVKCVKAGSHISYGGRFEFEHDTTVITVPIGYADGVPRRMGATRDYSGAFVLVGGRRCPIVGSVTMDQLMVDVGDIDVAIGDPIVLIGTQGEHTITARDWADHLGTIAYEVVCGITDRVPRIMRHSIKS